MGQRLFLVYLLFHIFSLSSGQVNPNKNRQYVLRQNRIGKEFVFSRSKPGNYDSTILKYLGKLTSRDGRVFKIIASKWYFGFGPHGTTRLVVFNSKNKYLGNYQLTMTYDLPTKIENNKLIFSNKHRDDCNSRLITKVSFYNGIPKQFFVECKDGYGDVNYFGDE